MNRRQLLGATGCLAVAGCLSDAASDDSEPDEGNESPTDEDGNEPEPTATAEVTDTTLTTRETSGGRVETAVTGTVENTGDDRLGMVNVAGKFYDASDQLLSSSPWGVRDLEPGEVWEPWIAYRGDGDVDRAELTVTDATAHSRTVNPSGVTIEDESIEIPTDAHAHPRVTGTVVNNTGETIPHLQARAKIAAENDNLLETEIGEIQELGDGETWSFDIQVPFANTDWRARIGRYKTVLTM